MIRAMNAYFSSAMLGIPIAYWLLFHERDGSAPVVEKETVRRHSGVIVNTLDKTVWVAQKGYLLTSDF